MIDLIYDGSFQGLLTALYNSFSDHLEIHGIYEVQGYQENLLYRTITIASDDNKAARICRAIKNRISDDALANIFYIFLSENNDIGMLVYNYLKLGWKAGYKVDYYLSDDNVLKIQNIKQKVLGECHRMLGLTRFKHLKGDVYYAPIEPDYNIVGLITPHFVKRIPGENFIIHDVKRGIAALYNKEQWVIIEFMLSEIPKLEDDEYEYQMLWKEYFDSIAIREKTNKRLQRKNMPVRYWKYLTEITVKSRAF